MHIANRNVALIRDNGFGWVDAQRTTVLESLPRPTGAKDCLPTPHHREVPPSRTLTL